eukprot:1158796-Pelagomonas_calceolata.AAC.5
MGYLQHDDMSLPSPGTRQPPACCCCAPGFLSACPRPQQTSGAWACCTTGAHGSRGCRCASPHPGQTSGRSKQPQKNSQQPSNALAPARHTSHEARADPIYCFLRQLDRPADPKMLMPCSSFFKSRITPSIKQEKLTRQSQEWNTHMVQKAASATITAYEDSCLRQDFALVPKPWDCMTVPGPMAGFWALDRRGGEEVAAMAAAESPGRTIAHACMWLHSGARLIAKYKPTLFARHRKRELLNALHIARKPDNYLINRNTPSAATVSVTAPSAARLKPLPHTQRGHQCVLRVNSEDLSFDDKKPDNSAALRGQQCAKSDTSLSM